jgi:DNA modification methylase
MGAREHGSNSEEVIDPGMNAPLNTTWGEEVDFPSLRSMQMYSHLVGARYPCRSVPLVPRRILDALKNQGGENIRVLDPFMGSGTTALEACLHGYQPVGLEVDPYARLISEASVQRLSKEDIANLAKFGDSLATNFAQAPIDTSLKPDINNLDLWFSAIVIDDLLKLKGLIHDFAAKFKHLEKFLLAALGDIIRAVSNAERQSLKPYISTRFKKTPGDVLTLYRKTLTRYLEGAEAAADVAQYHSRGVEWLKGDAVAFDCPTRVDVAITSPPYINAMDYVRCIRLESSWVGTGNEAIFKSIRSAQLGESVRSKSRTISDAVSNIIAKEFASVADVDPGRAATMAAYFEDMRANFAAVHAALVPGGSYHMIVGNSTVRNIDVETHRLLAEIACTVGFKWQHYFKYRIKDHRTSLPRNGRGGKINYEHVITLVAQ